MVKIIKKFQILHPIEKKVPYSLTETVALLLHGRAALYCTGPSPLYAGWYRLHLIEGVIVMDIEFSSIIDLSTDQDVLPTFQDNPIIIEALKAKAKDFMKAKFLHL